MIKSNLEHIENKWKKIKNLTIEDFFRDLSWNNITSMATVGLIAMCVLPIFVSITAKGSQFEYNKLSNSFAVDGVSINVLCAGEYWYMCLLAVAFFLCIVCLFMSLKRHYSNPVSNLNSASLNRKAFHTEKLLPICLVVLLGWSVLSAFHSDDWLNSFLGTLYRHEGVLTYVVYAVVFCVAAMIDTSRFKLIAEILVGTCALTGIAAADEGRYLGWLFSLVDDTGGAMFHQYNHYGYFLAVCAPLAFGLALQDSKKPIYAHIFRMLEVWLIFNAIAYNGTRGSFLAVTFVILCWNVIVFVRFKEKRFKLIILDFIFVFTILALHTESQLLARIMTLNNELVNAAQAVDTARQSACVDTIGSGRGALWRLGIQFSIDRPFLGYGPDNLGAQYSLAGIGTDRPHNELIQIAASLGIPALIFYLVGLAALFSVFIKNFKKFSLAEFSVFAAVGGYLFSSLFGNTMYYTTPYFYMMLGVSYTMCKTKQMQ